MYQIELSVNKTGKCVKKHLDEPFHRFEIPRNASFLGEGTIGTNGIPGLGVNVAVFGGSVGDGKTKKCSARQHQFVCLRHMIDVDMKSR